MPYPPMTMTFIRSTVSEMRDQVSRTCPHARTSGIGCARSARIAHRARVLAGCKGFEGVADPTTARTNPDHRVKVKGRMTRFEKYPTVGVIQRHVVVGQHRLTGLRLHGANSDLACSIQPVDHPSAKAAQRAIAIHKGNRSIREISRQGHNGTVVVLCSM